MVTRLTALVVVAALAFGCDAPAPPAQHRPSAHPGAPPASSAPAGSSTAPGPGRIEEHRFASTALGVTKRYFVYVPGDYATSGARYPVVYLLHGLGGNEANWPQGGGVAAAADRMALRALVVMPDGDAGFYANGAAPVDRARCLASAPPFAPEEPPADYCVATPRYESYVAQDLVREVDERFRTRASREGRGIAGLSMGGFGALVLSLRNSDVFSAAASTSGLVSLRYAGPRPYAGLANVELAEPPAWGRNLPGSIRDHMLGLFGSDPANWRAHDPIELAGALEPGRLSIRIDCGEQDDFGFDDQARHLHDVLEARGIRHEMSISPGRHDFVYWRARLPEILTFMRASLAPAG